MKKGNYDVKLNKALNIIMNNIASLTNEYSITKDIEKSSELKKKISVLNQIKQQIYIGNENIINAVISKNVKGIL